ncbi:YceI family protein [Tamlana fucoidanivorans]|uniref:YceI family protein n=1 Tax=Allotamlana fucoidanivorans TaxID=2583814 RepID=A0A5C4SGZ9_9FLAO|nr:YceI family protein [Tamlana fucoidanivorans]TNJ42871.1 YceI family protein [Tamlana fucoidanivorans]
MKKAFNIIVCALLLVSTLTACKNTSKEQNTSEDTTISPSKTTLNSGNYTANTASSKINWKASKPTGTHFGTVSLKNGSLTVTDGIISAGSFEIDMTSIDIQDMPKEDKNHAKLLNHLKSDDFFSVDTYSTATFNVLNTVEKDGATVISGNLTIKNIANTIEFPVTITQDNSTLTLSSATFTIDRTKWDIKYKSKSIFGDLGDKFINDEIELNIIIALEK